MVKEDSFGLFGWVGRGEGRMLEEGGERRRAGGRAPGSGKGWRGGGGVGAKGEARGRGGKWRPGEGGRRAA